MPKKTKNQNKPLHIHFVWDMSGSMGVITNETIEAFNDYVSQIRDDENAKMSLTVFDTVFEHWYTKVPVSEFPVITHDQYQPRGGTALYDAIAHAITETSHVLGDDRALIVVMTDGEENSSKEYQGESGRQALLRLVKSYEAKGWAFSFLGANIDAKAVATSIGVPAANAVYYSASGVGQRRVTDTLGAMTMNYSSGTTASSNLYAGLSTDIRDDKDVLLSK